MRSTVCVALVGLMGCHSAQAFLGALPAATTTGTTAAYHPQRQHSCSLAPHNGRLSSLRRGSLLRMAGDDDSKPEEAGPKPEAEQPTMPNVTEMMDKAAENDYVSRSSTTQGTSGMMGPAKQPEEDKRKEREKFDLENPKTNKWASGAFKRGVALQAVVLTFVIFLSFQPEEVGNLAICAPFSKAVGCVGFLEWVKIVFTGSPIPPM